MQEQKTKHQGMQMIQLLPTDREGSRKELAKLKDHKWLFLILDPELIKGIREYRCNMFRIPGLS